MESNLISIRLDSLFLCVFLYRFLWWYIHRITAKKYANNEVESLTSRFSGNNYKTAVEICLLLRRIAVMKFGRENVAGLSGNAWRRFLEKTVKKQVFSGEAGEIVENIMFIPEQQFHRRDVSVLVSAAKEWIAENT